MFISYDLYRIFYYAASFGNLTQAAKVLLSNQPNLSRAIKTLEAELGCALFVRSNRGMRLTPEGERLYAHVRVAFESIEEGEMELTQSRSLSRGMVYVAASELALHCALLPVLKEYRGRYPKIHIKISNHSTPQALHAIETGVADFAVVTTPTIPSAMLEEITVCKFREVAVCSASFAKHLRNTTGFAELLQYPLISLGTQTKSFELYSRFFAEEGLHFRPDIEAASADQILPMVRADLGIGFVPEAFLQNVEGIFVVQTEKPLPEREIRIAKRREQTLSLAAKELERLLLASFHGPA